MAGSVRPLSPKDQEALVSWAAETEERYPHMVGEQGEVERSIKACPICNALHYLNACQRCGHNYSGNKER